MTQRDKPNKTDALEALFNAKSIAVVGASTDPQKLSGLPLANLIDGGYEGDIYAVNQRGSVIRGTQTYRSVLDIAQPVDAAIVMLPASQTVQAVRDLGALGARTAVVAVSGFTETATPEGKTLQEDLLETGRKSNIRIVGPNCNGVYATHQSLSLGYNYIHGLKLQPGNIALISHSGAMAGPAVGLIESFGAGLSHFISCGNEVDLTLIDYAEFLLDDPNVRVFALILDSIQDGPRFRRFARRAREMGKAVLALKLGNSEKGQNATAAHSSRLSGSSAVYEAVFEEEGVALAPTLESLMIAAGVVSQGRGSARGGVIVGSTSGAGCIMMADALESVGVPLQDLAAETEAALDESSGFAQVMNPYDLGASGSSNASGNVAALASDPEAGVLNFFATDLQTDLSRRRYADAFTDAAKQHSDLAVLVTAPGPLSSLDREIYPTNGIPVIPSTSEAANTINVLHQISTWKAESQSLPIKSSHDSSVNSTVIDILRKGQIPHEWEARELLSAYGVSFPAGQIIDFDEVGDLADTLTYPVAIKGLARNLPHKSDHHLVELNIQDASAFCRVASEIREKLGELVPQEEYRALFVADMVTEGREIIAGLVRDSAFGMLLVVGPGGTEVELLNELHHLPLPTSPQRLKSVLQRGVLGRLLRGYRGQQEIDQSSLIELLLALSAAAPKLESVVEAVELNPVVVTGGPDGKAVALDTLITPQI